MNIEQLANYLRSGQHHRPRTPMAQSHVQSHAAMPCCNASSHKPVTLGPQTFASEDHAREHIHQLLAHTTPGQEITDPNDVAMLKALVTHYPYYDTTIKPYGIAGFTTKEHCSAKVLVVLLTYQIKGRPMKREVSVDRCLRNMEERHENVTPSVERCDDVGWIMAA